MKEGLAPKKLTMSRGDFLLSKKLIPNPDHIFLPNQSGKKEFVVGILDKYLKFLELLVFNERILGTTFSTFTEGEAKDIGDINLEEYLYTRFYLTEPVMEEKILKQLIDKGIFFYVNIHTSNLSPRGIVRDYLNISPQLKELLQKEINFKRPIFKKNAELVAHIALAEDVGVPLCISELAKQNGLPFALGKDESEAIKEFESAEVGLRIGVLNNIKEKMDYGARQELLRIKSLGINTIYPETPIAWQIIRDSSKLDDFLPVALQLRDEYKKFRQTMLKIEDELFSDDITLKRKRQLVKELDTMAAEIWNRQEDTTQRTAQEFSSLLDLALNEATNLSLSNFPKLLGYILGKPTEILVSKLHQRKIKVVLSSKKQFLSSSKWVDKLSEIFYLPKNEVKEQIIKYLT
jgi:hypothetical protein